MSIFLGILLTFLVLFIVVMVHEFGHFITARLTGMKVEEFGIGIPPRATKIFIDKKWTEFTLNWLPLGGFVRILGEDPRSLDSNNEWAFITKPLISRVLVLIAGVSMNFFLALCIFTGLFIYGTAPIAIIPIENNHSILLPSTREAIESGYLTHSGLILTPIAWSIAEKAWIGSGDIILAINGVIPLTSQDVIDNIIKNQAFDITVLWKETKTLHMVPKDGKVGMIIRYNNLNINENKRIQFNWYDALIAGKDETIASTKITLSFLSRIVNGIFTPKSEKEHEEAKSMLAGPIGLGTSFISMVENNAPIGIILVMIALLSINLGVVNILPFPALDGGRVVTTILYSIFSKISSGKEYFSKIEGIIHTIGFIILLVLMLYISWLDISRYF